MKNEIRRRKMKYKEDIFRLVRQVVFGGSSQRSQISGERVDGCSSSRSSREISARYVVTLHTFWIHHTKDFDFWFEPITKTLCTSWLGIEIFSTSSWIDFSALSTLSIFSQTHKIWHLDSTTHFRLHHPKKGMLKTKICWISAIHVSVLALSSNW